MNCGCFFKLVKIVNCLGGKLTAESANQPDNDCNDNNHNDYSTP